MASDFGLCFFRSEGLELKILPGSIRGFKIRRVFRFRGYRL